MSGRYVVEALLRPAVELNTAVVSSVAAFICICAPWAIALTPSVSYVMAGGFAVLAMIRTWQGIQVIHYRRNLRRLPRYQMSTKQIPVSHQRLFLGKGFRWQQKHTQRLQDTRRPEVERFVQPPQIYQLARALERRTEYRWPGLSALLRKDSPLNPVRPLPPVEGNPMIHGIEPQETEVFMDLRERVGHTLVMGTTRVGKTRLAINLHCDEFNELMGDEFIPLINKGGGAGMQVTAYTQTSSDIEARISSPAKTAQVIGNFNTLIMLRVRDNRTAELLTSQLPEVEIYSKTLVSGHSDIADVEQGQDFTSSTQDRVGTVKTPLVTPAEMINLPKGQAFALLEGGQLWKIRMPLPTGDDDDALMPANLQKIAEQMRRHYRTSENWWEEKG
ncbi:TraM recognition domain-containing protein [Xenorhabdus bovienii]|uniref:Putative plasmid transfer TraD protein n=1 Tax=Xenorhabdus bovienii TaxID=40576 RepID=A0A0B6X587_XENBV|nr:TraM recognition domain-containing protein [Xenorhabdus bovienii]CDM88730.1 Putative plasmid transfer TraD protein [Xenorhabdus bovienii]